MAFNFTETFTIEMPDFQKVDIDFSEADKASKGLIIEVAAIHERTNRQL